MALTTASLSLPPLQCDDEETLTLLVKTGDVDPSRLDGFQKRLEEDFAEGSQYWNDLVKNLNKNFKYSSTPLPEPTAAAAASTTQDDRLETAEGKKHIAALCALLQISKTRAIEITRGIVQKLYKNETLLPALLGTSDFFLKCVLYHFQQRLVRLQLLTECLRVEQDHEKPASEATSKVLDNMDAAFEDESRQRGLFRRLLTIACTPLVLPTRDQMAPCQDLTFKTTTPGSSAAYNSLAASLLEETRLRTNRERVQAMEALLVLLYHRIKGGVQRSDLCLLVQAFQACGIFESNSQERLAELAGLICAESIQLWRAFQPDNQDGWVSQHPLLQEEASSSTGTQMEMEALKTILLLDSSSSSEEMNLKGPQSLALLSFGLLLRLAYDSLVKSSDDDDSQAYWRTYQASGTEIVTIANEWGFEYLEEAISNLVESDVKSNESAPRQKPFQFYDWQLSNPKSSPLLLEADNTEMETPADIVSYTSIAREVLVSSISAFPSILSTESSTDNLGMLCKLASSLYQANPVLSEEFWSLWQDFISPNPPEMPLPMCDLFYAAHDLAKRALVAFQQNRISSVVVLPAVAPFFQLLASLCHSPDIVEATLNILDAGLIRSALLACYLPEAVAGSEEYSASRKVVLNALVSLAKTGPSKDSLEKLRLSMEEGNQVMVDGPRVLTRIAISTNDPKVIESILHLMASLLDGASQRWAMELARQCMPSQRRKSVLATFLEPGTGTTNAAATVLAEFIEHMTSVVFCDSFQDNDAIAFLQVVGEGILSSSTTLIPYMSTEAATIGEMQICYETAEVVLRAFSRFLSLVRAVMELHPSPTVKSAAYEVRDSLINTLATSVGLGEAIAHYAVAPVALGIAAHLWDALESGEIGTKVSETKSEGEKSFGAWQFVASKNNGQDSDLVHGRKLLLDSIAEFCGKDLDLEGLQQRNWTGTTDTLAPLRVAESAMQLLSMWSLHVDNIVTGQNEGTDATLAQPGLGLISKLSPYGILTSRATCPFPCRESSTFSAVWESVGIPNFDLILPYFADAGDDSTTASAIPTIVSLDVLHACIVHAQQSSSIDSEGASSVFRVVHNSERLPKLISKSISTANQLANKSTLTDSEDTAVLHGLLGLRLLCACIEASPAISDKMLHLEGTPLLPTLTTMASKVRNLLGLPNDSSSEILNNDSSILQMRLAAGAVTVLSAVWTSARSMTPGPSGSASARLGKLVDEKASFVADLLLAVMEYSSANDIESKIPPSTESEYARCAVASFMSRSLDILATEVAYYRSNRENRNAALEAALKGSFFQPQRFTSFNGFKYSAVSTLHFGSMGFDRLQSLTTRPRMLLDCFPTTSTWQSSQDAYVLENTFDVGAATKWLSEISQQDDDAIEGSLSRLSVTHQFAVCDLRLISSWKRLAEALVLFNNEEKVQPSNTGPNAGRLVVLAKDTLQALHLNIGVITEAQVEVSEDFMQASSNKMAKTLAELFLFLLEMGSQDEAELGMLDRDDFLDLLELLAKTSEMVHTMVSVSHAGAFATGSLEMCCTLERPLFAAAILLDSWLSARSAPSQEQQKRERDVRASLCRVTSKVLRVLGKVMKAAARDSLVTEERKEDNRETLRCCISLFTILVAKGHGSQMSDASYFKLVSKTLMEYDVLKEIIGHGMSASNAAATSILSSRGDKAYGIRGPSSTEIDSLVVVQSVLNLLYSVAEADNADMLSIFIGTQLSQFVTRNPLFQYVGQAWTQNARNVPPRGYVLSREAGASNRSSILPGSLQLCRSDPLHSIWLTSMQVLQASLRSSTKCLSIQGTESIGKHFFNASVEFLEIHKVVILSCLKSCGGSKLTGNMVLESTQILSLASELFKRDHRDAFLHMNNVMCEELIEWAKAVIVNMSKFLGASGTARELFRGLEDYESMDPDLVEQGSGPNDNKVRHPLLSGGRLQDAKHEAYKFSHFAARCCERITKLDIETGSTVPSRLRHLSLDRKNDEPLEQACRLSVTSDYAMKMERIASQCLSQAVSTVWKTHPVSHSFKVFSEREVMQLDVMNLVQNGVVLSYRASCGESLLVDGTSETFDDLRFGRVCGGDTLNRTWTVKVIRGNGDVATGEVEVVRARQLAGIEDVSMRKAATAYLPGPDTTDALEKGSPSLSVGHLILVLRWCHQKFLSLRERNLQDGPAQMKNAVRIAEQTVALLAAELSIHAEIGSALNMPKGEKAQLDFQVYEMFADPEVLTVLDTNAPVSSAHMQQGRLKDLIQGPAWDAIRPQVRQEIERTWKAIKEHEQNRQKRSFGETNWYSGNLGRSRGYKSAFRG